MSSMNGTTRPRGPWPRRRRAPRHIASPVWWTIVNRPAWAGRLGCHERPLMTRDPRPRRRPAARAGLASPGGQRRRRPALDCPDHAFRANSASVRAPLADEGRRSIGGRAGWLQGSPYARPGARPSGREARRITADPQHRRRLVPTDELGRSRERSGQGEQSLRAATHADSLEGQDGQQLEVVARRRYDPRLQPPRRPDEQDAPPRLAAPQLVGYRNAGKEVPPVPLRR